MQRFWRYAGISGEAWNDWRWQLRNRLSNYSDLASCFPRLSPASLAAFSDYRARFRFALTPYALSLIELDEEGNPKADDPIWNQFRFFAPGESDGCHDYDGASANWETKAELPTAILHHKYPDRAIIRLTDQCFGHCNYCYQAARVLDRRKSSPGRSLSREWDASLAYLRQYPQVRDVLLSGGDPLVFPNQLLDRLLRALRGIESIQSVRLNTRAVTFAPSRIDDELIGIFERHRLTALEIQLVHPREITAAFDAMLARFDRAGYRPLILWRAPMLGGINDSYEVLEELLLKLYTRRIQPYYLFHYAPFSPGRSRQGVSIRRGVEIMAKLRRAIPGPAMPRYTLFHLEGKQDIPLEIDGTPEFRYEQDESGRPIVRFKNWRGHWVTYPDVPERAEAGWREAVSNSRG